MPLIYASAGESERSKSHRYVEKILDDMGLNYISEQPFPPYQVDIYLPEWHIGIEVDGPFHSKSKDKQRDAYLELYYGLRILRTPIRWITKQKIIKAVTKFVEVHADSGEERKSIWLTRL